MNRVADIIAEELVKAGIQHVFMVTGGGAMHLNDAIGRQPQLQPIFNHHEQACAIAAEAYTRLSGRTAALNVTTGPGGINALNGVHGAFTDSIAMVVISGQVKRETLARNHSPNLRQLGDQEVDIIDMVRPIAKYATLLQDPTQVRVVMQKAIFLARNGRPGPVWVDVPIDVQGKPLDVKAVPDWNQDLLALAGDTDIHPNVLCSLTTDADTQQKQAAQLIIDRLQAAKHPLLMLGTGVRIAGMEKNVLQWAERLNIPVVTAFNAHDLIADKHPLYAGRPGTVGNRTGNFATQNTDCLVIFGCRLNIRQISYNWDSFARQAWLAHIDVDRSELDKHTLHADLPIHADLKTFIPLLDQASTHWAANPAHEVFRLWCKSRLEQYPVVSPAYWQQTPVNPYCFMHTLFEELSEGDVVVAANATATIASFQAGEIKPGIRLFSNSGSASMGYDLPAAVGAAIAARNMDKAKTPRIICLAGDGSIMMNLQELQTIVGYQLPVKIVVLNNDGYHSIRQSQRNHFPDNALGIGPQTGVTFPNFIALAQAFGYPSYRIDDHKSMQPTLASFLSQPGPALCEVLINPEQDFAPKLASRRLEDGSMLTPELDDMAPFLSREELAQNRINTR